MANPSQIENQVRFALSQIPGQNAHHTFEHICRHLTQQFVCSNVLPATGPVSAGGDQGRDFETFRTYLSEELGQHGAFLGLVSEGPIAFICTTQSDGLHAKLRQDIEKVCASGHPVHEICAFTLASVSVGIRHQLETETQQSYGVHLEFHDAESIASLLARPSGFWIAEQFLSIPAEIRPEADPSDGDLSAEYQARRQRWREKSSPNPTYGDFIDLKEGLRTAAFHDEARSDLPFWLGLVRQLLANPECSAPIQQRARYELAVATLRGTNNLRPVDNVARAFLDGSLTETEPARLLDASALLLYASTAVQLGITSLTPDELGDWQTRLIAKTRYLLSQETPETPHRRANLLYALGHLGLHPPLWETGFQIIDDGSYVLDQRSLGVQLPDPADISFADISVLDNFVLGDVSQTLSAWTELVNNLQDTPLFPIENLADILQLLFPLWSSYTEWRELLDSVEAALGERIGRYAIGARARDRAMKLLEAGRCLDALEEFHRTKVEWWSGETVRGSLLAMVIIAELYLELRLPQASKSYALAVSYIALSRRDDDLADLIPAGLLMAANADFVAGAWCSAVELYDLGLVAQYALIKDGTDFEKHPPIQNALLHLTYTRACAKIIDSDLADLIGKMVVRIGFDDIIESVIHAIDREGTDFGESFGANGLVARPFADLGDVRYIRFSALGTDWTLAVANDTESVRLAERFAAAAQMMLAALAREDLCLVQSHINIRIENRSRIQTATTERIHSLPSNNGREWVVRLAPIGDSNDADPQETSIELLAMLTMIIREVSLLSDDDFSRSLDRAFERGLSHNLSPARPYDELASAFANDTGAEIQRSRYHTPWDCREGTFASHNELGWRNGPGPTYSRDQAEEMLRTRYQNFDKGLRITVPMLESSAKFRSIVKTLRAKGWLDWHIMAAIANIVMNHRFPANRNSLTLEETRNEMLRAMLHQESAEASPVPIGLFMLDAMDRNRKLAMLPLVKHWGLELRQRTPDIPAIERLLAHRYGYWDDDVPHEDPFPENENGGSNGGLVLVKDIPPQP